MLCVESTASSTSLTLAQDWKHPRTALGFTGNQGYRDQSTVLRCVTNNLIPCTAELFAAMGKMRFNVTVLSVTHAGHAKAPNKKGPGGKYLKLVNCKPLFEETKNEESVSGVRMYHLGRRIRILIAESVMMSCLWISALARWDCVFWLVLSDLFGV